jgi:signal transduction histidine kinase
MSKGAVLVVPDATLDARFCDNQAVVGPANFRFYAGAPLISPEGYKLGTFCIIDTVPRAAFTAEQTSMLVDLADMVVKVMVDRRSQLQREKQQADDSTNVLAYTAHDLLAPLTGVQLSLARILQTNERAPLTETQMEQLKTAVATCSYMTRICQSALDSYRAGFEVNTNVDAPGPGASVTDLDDFVKNLYEMVDPIPKKVRCIITLHESGPKEIVADDLQLFRSALNLLTHAIDRTESGEVSLTIRPDHDALLIFECEDTGADIPVEEYQYLFQANPKQKSNIGLSSIASLIHSLDGEYGFRPRGIDCEGNVMTDANGRRRSGSIFWFSIPLLLPSNNDSNTASQVDLRQASRGFSVATGNQANPKGSNDGMREGRQIDFYSDGCNAAAAALALSRTTLSDSGPPPLEGMDSATKIDGPTTVKSSHR